MAKLHRSILGCCGEFFVASYLSGMGLKVSLTKPGTRAVDMNVTTKSGRRSVSLQVKTGRGEHNLVSYKKTPEHNYWVWQTGKSAQNTSSPSHWFAFVIVKGWPQKPTAALPDILFIPSKLVVKTLRDPEGQDSWFWIFASESEKYRGVAGFKLLKKALAG